MFRSFHSVGQRQMPALEVLCLLLLSSWGSLTGSLVELEIRWDISPSRVQSWLIESGYYVDAVGIAVWLGVLVYGRTNSPSPLPRRAWALRAGAAVAGLAALSRAAPFTPAPFHGNLSEILHWVALSWLAVEIARRHGASWRSLGILEHRTSTRKAREDAFKIFRLVYCWSFLGIYLLQPALAVLFASISGLSLVSGKSQDEIVGLHSVADYVAGVVRACVLEDLVVIALLVVMLTKARWPTWASYSLVVGVEVGIHAYMGLFMSLFVLPFALSRVILYRRYRRLTPIVMAHGTWDLWESFHFDLFPTGSDTQQMLLSLAPLAVVLLSQGVWKTYAALPTGDEKTDWSKIPSSK